MNIVIESFKDEDINSIVSIWNEVIDEGNSYFWTEHFSVEDVKDIFNKQRAVYCAKNNSDVVGFYILHDNYPGRGNHISNALYAVKKEFRSRGIGRMLAEHSLMISKRYGYKAIQFNSVVSTNDAAIRLWEKLGFSRVGQINNAFRKDESEVDLYIYYKSLD